ncbi:MAG: trypsin-like peptidase domain-containing protein [Clostridiales bacterium]|nr:trypsin-like peptidase domain-containing protein [Clostridiales bacterium]
MKNDGKYQETVDAQAESERGDSHVYGNGNKRDTKLLWIVIIVMTVICAAVGVISSVLTGYFMRRGAKPIKIDSTYKYEAISAVVEARKPCIVEIEAGGHGSGVITKLESNKIFILTNYHVIQNNLTNVKVRFMGADEWYINVKVLGYDIDFDVAVLTIDSSTAPFEVFQLDGSDCFSRTATYKEGDLVVAIGNAMGHGIAAYDGIISRRSEVITTDSNGGTDIAVLRTTAALNHGMSGGGLFDTEGRLIGLNVARMSSFSNDSVDDSSYAVPISIVYPLYKQILAHGNGGQIDKLLDIDAKNTKILAGSKTSVGAVHIYTESFGGFTAEYRSGGKLTVIAIDGGDKPAKAVKEGDVIKAIGVSEYSVNVTSNICDLCSELLRYRQNAFSGSALAFTIERDGKTRSVPVDGFYRFVD